MTWRVRVKKRDYAQLSGRIHANHASPKICIYGGWVRQAHVQLRAAAPLHLRPHRRTRSPQAPQSDCKQSGSQSSGTIELQASRSSHACLQDITRHSHRLARLSGPSATPLDRAAAPSAPPERRAEALPERQVEKLAVSTDTLPSPAALFSNQLAGTNGGGPGPGDAHELRQRPGPAVRT